MRCIPWLISIIDRGRYFLVAITIEGDISMDGSVGASVSGVNGVQVQVQLDPLSESLVGDNHESDFAVNSNFEFCPTTAGVVLGLLSSRIACGSLPSTLGME